MTVERIFRCDGPKCERHVQTQRKAPPCFLTVTGDAQPTLHFCGWDCVLRYAGTIEPEEVIES
jgi:hypothetical protein